MTPKTEQELRDQIQAGDMAWIKNEIQGVKKVQVLRITPTGRFVTDSGTFYATGRDCKIGSYRRSLYHIDSPEIQRWIERHLHSQRAREVVNLLDSRSKAERLSVEQLERIQAIVNEGKESSHE